MKTLIKRTLSALLCLALILTMLPLSALAEDEVEITSLDVSVDMSDTPYYAWEDPNTWCRGDSRRIVVYAGYFDGSNAPAPIESLDFFLGDSDDPLGEAYVAPTGITGVALVHTADMQSAPFLIVKSKDNPEISGQLSIIMVDYKIRVVAVGSEHLQSVLVSKGESVQLGTIVYPESRTHDVQFEDWNESFIIGASASTISSDGLFFVSPEETGRSFSVSAPIIDNIDGAQVEMLRIEVDYEKSDDATLTSLAVNTGELSPVFSPDTTSYAVTVPYSANTIDITAIANDVNAAVSGVGTKTLVVGENICNVLVIAEDGTTKTYTITVTREAPPQSGNFVIDVASLTGDVSNDNWSYNHATGTITLVEDVIVTGVKTDADRTLIINIPTKKTVIWKADYSGSTAVSNALIELRGAGTFEMVEGEIAQTGGGNAVYIPNNDLETELEFRGRFTLRGGEIKSANGHAIYREAPALGNGYCEINISGGTVRRTGGDTTGSAVHYGRAYLTMTGGEIISTGWCIDAYYCESLHINGGIIKSAASAIRGNTIFDVPIMNGGTVEAGDDAIYTCAGAIIKGGTVTAGDFAVYVDERLQRENIYVAYLTGTIISGEVLRQGMTYAIVVEVDTIAIPFSRHGISAGITIHCIPAGITWEPVTWDLLHWKNLPSLHFQPTPYANSWYGWGYLVGSEVDGISLDKSGTQAFPAATYGYDEQSALTVTVSKTGNQDTGALSVSLSGVNNSSFTLSKTNFDSIATSGSDTFTVKPVTGLSAGTYTATVTVSGADVVSQSFTVSFTVLKKLLVNAMIDSIAAQDYTGSQLTPFITVKDGTATLVLNTDYENVTYGANVNVSTGGSVIITGKGNYQGTATAGFTIAPAPLTLTADNKDITVGMSEPTYTYSVSGLQGNDTAAVITTAPALSVTNFSSITADTFTINISGGVANSNYTITNRVNGTLTVSVLPKETTPNAAINFTTEQLTGLTANAVYSVNGGANISADSNGNIAIDSGWLGADISIVKKGDGTTKTDSDAQCLPIPSRPEAPATPVGGAGQIAGVDGLMEYRSSTGAWTAVSGTSVTGLSAGSYEVRLKATATGFASASATVTVTAAIYTVTFDANGGSVSPSSAQTGSDGKLANLPAPTRSGNYSFSAWYTAASGGTAIKTSTVFTANTTVYARWTYIGDNGNTGGSGGTTTTPDTSATEKPVDADANGGSIPVTQNTETGVVNVSLGEADTDTALEKAAETGEITITIPKTDTIDETTPVSATIASDAMLAIAESGVSLTIEAPAVSMTFDANAVGAIAGAGEVVISAGFAAPDVFNERQKEAVGDRPVYDFTIKVDGKAVSEFGGYVKVTLPYTLQPGDDWNAIIISYIDANGNVQTVKNCVYDGATGKISFTTDHFSLYMIDHKAVSFDDVQGSHWAKGYITFVAARELFSGTGNSGFDPNGYMTRAMFATVLARLDGADLSGYATSRFDDVLLGQWYTASVEWAADKGIVSGTGDGNFAPDSPITREQMVVMLYNYMNYKDMALPSGTAAVFADESGISSWAYEAVKAMQAIGIVSGKPGNAFDPLGYATRAEVATIFARFVEYLTTGMTTVHSAAAGNTIDTNTPLAMLPGKEQELTMPESEEPNNH